jgi:hypothetical protein
VSPSHVRFFSPRIPPNERGGGGSGEEKKKLEKKIKIEKNGGERRPDRVGF